MAPKTRASTKAKSRKSLKNSKKLLVSKTTKLPKILPKASVEKECIVYLSVDCAPCNPEKETSVEMKRQRGRPRKYARPEDRPSATLIGPKRPRGRPPKHSRASTVVSSSISPSSSKEHKDESLCQDSLLSTAEFQDDYSMSSLMRASTSSGFTSEREAGTSMSPRQNQSSHAATEAQTDVECNGSRIRSVEEENNSVDADVPAAERIPRNIVYQPYFSSREIPGKLPEQPLTEQFDKQPIPSTFVNYYIYDHDYLRQVDTQDSKKAEEAQLKKLMQEVIPERKNRRPRQKFREMAYQKLMEMQEAERLQGLPPTPIPPEDQDGPQYYEEINAQGKTIHAIIKTSQGQEKALHYFLKEKKTICLRDIHNIATTTELPVGFVTIWLQHNIQNNGLTNTFQQDPEPVQLDLHPLITQPRDRSGSKKGKFFVPANTANYMKHPNAQQYTEKQVNQSDVKLEDELHGKDGSSPGPSTQGKQERVTPSEEEQKDIDTIQSDRETSAQAKKKVSPCTEKDQKIEPWLPSKFAETGISMYAVMNSQYYPLPSEAEYTNGDELDRTINSVVRNCQRFGTPTSPRRVWEHARRIQNRNSVPSQATSEYPSFVRDMAAPDFMNFYAVQGAYVNQFCNDSNYNRNTQNQWDPQMDAPQYEYNNFDAIPESAVSSDRHVQHNNPPLPPKILPESGELYLPTTATLDIDRWTVDEVVQWAEFFLKGDGRRDLRRNGVNGFALKQLFLEDNKYWLSTGMAIGDIELLKLHTAKVINSFNGH